MRLLQCSSGGFLQEDSDALNSEMKEPGEWSLGFCFFVSVCSESFFISQPFSASVDYFSAIAESRAFEQPQHGPVVEIGVDAEGLDAAF